MRDGRPKDRKDLVHGVAGCKKKERFYCKSGNHWVCVCRGCADDMPDTCDWCYARKERQRQTHTKRRR